MATNIAPILREHGSDYAMPEHNAPAGSLNILVVDDEANIRKVLSVSLEIEGHTVTAVGNFQDAVAEAAQHSFDLAFVDLRLGTTDGLDLIPLLLASTPSLKIVVITAYASIASMVEAMRRGATDYIPKPFTPAQVNIVVGKIAEVRFLEHKVADLQEELERATPGADFSSANPAMQRAVNVGREVAASDANVLLRGENGTGKSALALAIHHWSNRLERLREPTLWELEPQIDLKMREGSEENGNDATPEPDQVMVCLSPLGPNSEMLLRYASRLAGRLNRNWYAVYVQTPSEQPTIIDVSTQRVSSRTLTVAKQLGAMVSTYNGEDVADTILRFAREHRVSHIVMGYPGEIPLSNGLVRKKSIVDQLIKKINGNNGGPSRQCCCHHERLLS